MGWHGLRCVIAKSSFMKPRIFKRDIACHLLINCIATQPLQLPLKRRVSSTVHSHSCLSLNRNHIPACPCAVARKGHKIASWHMDKTENIIEQDLTYNPLRLLTRPGSLNYSSTLAFLVSAVSSSSGGPCLERKPMYFSPNVLRSQIFAMAS